MQAKASSDIALSQAALFPDLQANTSFEGLSKGAVCEASAFPTKPSLLCLQVNRKLAAQAMLDARKREAEDMVELEGEPSAKKRKPSGPSVLEDPRFQALFEDPSFAVDEEADEYKTLHPNAGRQLGCSSHADPGHWLGSQTPAKACQVKAGQGGVSVADGDAKQSCWQCLWRGCLA